MMVPLTLEEVLQEVINCLDPCGLLKLGAPLDEYHTEVVYIGAMLRAGEQITPEWIQACFEEQGIPVSREMAEQMTDSIEQAYKEYEKQNGRY
jgi:hypothetical protein